MPVIAQRGPVFIRVNQGGTAEVRTFVLEGQSAHFLFCKKERAL